MLRDNEEGMAFVMVLILTAVVSVLVTSLLISAGTHTDIAVQEETRSQAFHLADAGVEYAVSNISLEALDEYDEDEWKSKEVGNVNFDIKYTGNGSELISRGSYRGHDVKIQFELAEQTFTGPYENPFNLNRQYDDDYDHFDFRGNVDHSDDVTFMEREYDDWDEFVNDRLTEEELDSLNTIYESTHEIRDDKVAERKEINGDLDIRGGAFIEGSVYVVEGEFRFGGGATLKDSVVIIKERVDIDGSGGLLNNSLLFIYGDVNDETLIDSGTPATSLPDGDIDTGELPTLTDPGVRNWRQITD